MTVTGKQIERACELTRDYKAKSVKAYAYPGVAGLPEGYIALELEVNAGGTGTTWLTFGIDPDGMASS